MVFQATELETREVVAIKKVLQDKRFKNRELQIMKQLVKLPHPNIVLLKQCFYSNGEKPEELYLNLVLEYIPETVYSVARQHQKAKQPVPLLHVKLYVYQLARALAHIHGLGICHRDIKPQNLLLDPTTHVLKLCDFGSAKFLVKGTFVLSFPPSLPPSMIVSLLLLTLSSLPPSLPSSPGEPNVSYICSRYYRAPELIFGSTSYTTSIDIWSEGCVAAELLLGHPLFPGDSGVDQLVEIIKVLGTPTREEIKAMNSNYTEFKFPQIKAHPWNKVRERRYLPPSLALVLECFGGACHRRLVTDPSLPPSLPQVFRSRLPQEAIDVVARMLAYAPERRIRPIESCAHAFFDELRDPATCLADARGLPPLFNFTDTELRAAPPGLINLLVPPHARAFEGGGGGGGKDGGVPAVGAGAAAGAAATTAAGGGGGEAGGGGGGGREGGHGHAIQSPAVGATGGGAT